jgi:hypothetical protein
MRWHTTRPAAVAETVAGVYARWGGELADLPEQGVVDAILAAAKAAGSEYGCFVNPQGERPTLPAAAVPQRARNSDAS